MQSKLVFCKIICFLYFLGFCHLAGAQNSFELSGRVVSQKGNPIPFCYVITNQNIKDGTLTEYNGYFKLKTHLNDTLTISYVGYKTLKVVVKNKEDITLIMALDSKTLPEFVVKAKNKKQLTPKKIIQKVIGQWENNYLTFKNDFLVNMDIDFHIKKDTESVYSFQGNIDLSLLNHQIYANKKDTSKRMQKGFPFINNSLGGNPYDLIQQLGFSVFRTNKFSYKFGDITQYKNKNVYDIEFHQSEGKGMCESGGYYLITKDNYIVLYAESSGKKCSISQEKKKDISWNYFKIKYFFNQSTYSKYYISKIKSISKYNVSENELNTSFYQKESFIINKIEKKSNNFFNTKTLINAKDVFYKKQIP